MNGPFAFPSVRTCTLNISQASFFSVKIYITLSLFHYYKRNHIPFDLIEYTRISAVLIQYSNQETRFRNRQQGVRHNGDSNARDVTCATI